MIPFIIWTLFLSVGVVLNFISLVEARQTNYTIDDTLGDSHTRMQVQYSPSPGHPNANDTVWVDQANCTMSGCHITPPCQQHNNSSQCTWSSATPPNGTVATASFQFNGSAVYIYFILANIYTSGIRSDTTSDFFLDGEQVGHYEHAANASGTFQYNSLVYSNTSIPFKQHQFSIHVSYPSYAVFDYAVYTTELDEASGSSQIPSSGQTGIDGASVSSTPTSALSTSSGPNQNKSKLVGIILGVILPLILLFAGVLYFIRHRDGLQSFDLGAIFDQVKVRTPRIFPSSQGDTRSSTRAEEGNASESQQGNHREFKLTPLPHRRNRRQRTSKMSFTRPFTPGLDMHCRGDDVSTLGDTATAAATPRSRFDFIFPHGGTNEKLMPPRITVSDGESVHDEKPSVRPQTKREESGIMITVEHEFDVSPSQDGNLTRGIKTLSQSSLKKMEDLHSRPLPPVPASQSPSSPKSPVRLLPSPRVSPAVLKDQQPPTPPPVYIP